MCEPVSIGTAAASAAGAGAAATAATSMSMWQMASLAISAVSTVAGFVGQQQQADAAYSSSMQSYHAQLAANEEQQRQINAKAADEMSERARAAMIERGRLNVIGAESGLGGNTPGRLESESFFNEGYDVASIDSNRINSIRQSNLQRDGIYANTQSRINSIKQPSLLGAGLTIAGAYAGERAKIPSSKAPTKTDYIINPYTYADNYG